MALKRSLQRLIQKLAGEGGVRLLSVAFMMVLARALGASDFGRYSSAMAYAAIFCILVDLGTNSILTREIARHPDKHRQIVRASHALKLIAAATAFLGLALSTWILPITDGQRFLVLGLGIMLIGQILTEYFSALLSGKEEMGWEAGLKIASRALTLLGGFIAVAQKASLLHIAGALAAGTVLSYAAAGGILYYRFGTFGLTLDLPYLKHLLRACLPIFGSVVFWILYDNQDILLLNYFKFPNRDIGHFAAAMKIIDVLRVFPVLVVGAFFPSLSRLAHTDRALFFRRAVWLTAALGSSLIGLTLLTYAGASRLVLFFYDQEFLPAGAYLRWLLPAYLGIGINHLYLHVLIALDQERRILAASATLCLTNLAVSLLLLPRMGVIGACYALAVGEAAFFLFLWSSLRKSRSPTT